MAGKLKVIQSSLKQDIEITDELKTITLRKKTADTSSVRVFSFLFEKIETAK